MPPNLLAAIFLLALSGVGLVFWVLPDRSIWAGTGSRKRNGMLFCLIGACFALLALVGVAPGRPG